MKKRRKIEHQKKLSRCVFIQRYSENLNFTKKLTFFYVIHKKSFAKDIENNYFAELFWVATS